MRRHARATSRVARAVGLVAVVALEARAALARVVHVPCWGGVGVGDAGADEEGGGWEEGVIDLGAEFEGEG